jgi:hypothetical protein
MGVSRAQDSEHGQDDAEDIAETNPCQLADKENGEKGFLHQRDAERIINSWDITINIEFAVAAP